LVDTLRRLSPNALHKGCIAIRKTYCEVLYSFPHTALNHLCFLKVRLRLTPGPEKLKIPLRFLPRCLSPLHLLLYKCRGTLILLRIGFFHSFMNPFCHVPLLVTHMTILGQSLVDLCLEQISFRRFHLRLLKLPITFLLQLIDLIKLVHPEHLIPSVEPYPTGFPSRFLLTIFMGRFRRFFRPFQFDLSGNSSCILHTPFGPRRSVLMYRILVDTD